jgi:hypothetical protein
LGIINLHIVLAPVFGVSSGSDRCDAFPAQVRLEQPCYAIKVNKFSQDYPAVAKKID